MLGGNVLPDRNPSQPSGRAGLHLKTSFPPGRFQGYVYFDDIPVKSMLQTSRNELHEIPIKLDMGSI